MSDYVLNTASLAEKYSEFEPARIHLAALLRGLALLDADCQQLPMLRLNLDPWLHPMVIDQNAAVTTLGQLVHSFYGTVDHDLAAFFDSLSRTVPAENDLDNASIEALLRLTVDSPAVGYEQTIESVKLAGVDGLMCAVMDFVLIGLLRDDRWDFDRMAFLSGCETYEFDHVAESRHAEAIRRRRLDDIRGSLSTKSFSRLRNRAFPHLQFGMDVQGQLEKFSTTLMPLLFKRLAELDERAAAWLTADSDRFPAGGTEITGETPRTMQRYGTKRSFRSASGLSKIFEDHMWVDQGHRIHMIRDVRSRTVEVGYVGPHLPTMDNPT